MIRHARATTMLIVMLAVGMTGCDSTAAAPADQAASPASTPNFGSLPPEPQYRTLSQPDLAAVLLDISDLPANYVREPSAASEWLTRRFCTTAASSAAPLQVSASHVKDRGRPGDVIRSAIRQYATPEEAASSFDAMETAVRNCRKEIAGGRSHRYAAAVLPAGQMYRTLAVRVTSGDTTTLQGFATSGRALVIVEMGELTPPDVVKSGMNAAAYDGSRLLQLIEKQLAHYADAARVAR